MRKAVFDTNILVSALWSSNGNPANTVKTIGEDTVVCYNDEIMSEYKDVLYRDKFSHNFSHNQVDILLAYIKRHGEIVTPKTSCIPMPDESDRIFYDTAKESGAILITGNTKHYPNEVFIKTPFEYLQEIHRTNGQY